jgi:hypothetical protein
MIHTDNLTRAAISRDDDSELAHQTVVDANGIWKISLFSSVATEM